MPNSTKPPDEDPYLQVLVGIVSELRAIRQELQQFNSAATGRDSDAFECRCGQTLYGESNAEQHARSDHNAPADHWEELYA